MQTLELSELKESSYKNIKVCRCVSDVKQCAAERPNKWAMHK